MIRSITALLFVGCFTFHVCAQIMPAQPAAAAQTPATGAAIGNQAGAPTQESAQPSKQSGTARNEASQMAQGAEKHPGELIKGSPFDKFQEFSAIMVGGPTPGNEDPAHIYRSGNLMRVEGRLSKLYLITDLNKNQTHGFSLLGCTKFNLPYTRTFPFSVVGPDTTYARTAVGEETVDGHKCQVEDLVVSSPKRREPAKWRLWEAEDLNGFPIKLEMRGNPMNFRSMEYKNVVLGPQDPTLFLLPNKCESIGVDSAVNAQSQKPKPAPATKPQ